MEAHAEPGPAKRFKRKLRQGSLAEGRTQEFAAQLPGASEELQSQCSPTQCLGGCRGVLGVGGKDLTKKGRKWSDRKPGRQRLQTIVGK
jgi:hypothetical protein